MGMASDQYGTIKLMYASNAGNQGQFYLDVISAEDNTFYIRSKNWPTWYVIMNDDSEGTCRGQGSRPGTNGQWKLVKYPNGSILLTTEKWPTWFLYVYKDYSPVIYSFYHRGRIYYYVVKSKYNYPGKRGEWKLW